MIRKLIFIFLIMILCLFGCNNYDIINEESNNYPPINPQPNEDKLEITLFYPNQQLTHLVSEIRMVNRDTKDSVFIVIKELFKGTEKKGLINIIPSNIKLLSVDILEETAYINLSNTLKENNLSEKEEAFVLYSIVNTLCSLENVDTVQVLIEGKILEKFINIYSIKEPLTYSSLIVNNEYISSVTVVRDFYESITSGDFGNTLKTLYLEKDNYTKLGRIKAEIALLHNSVDDFQIISYIINRYNEEIEIIADIKLYDYTSFNRKEYQVISQVFNLIYEDNSLKIKGYDNY